MKHTLLCTSLLAIGLLAGPAMARQTRGADTSRSREQASQPGKGLDALDDERVLTEIAGRGLADLLAHAMEREGVPEHRRRALLARISLNRLMTGEPLSTAERRELVRDVIANVEETVKEATDPQLLFEQAQLLITKGVDEETRLLEYFGDNPALRRYLAPVTEGITRMLTRAAELYQAEADAIANRISGPSDPAVKQWEQADQLTQRVRDYKAFADYNRLLAMDPEAPQRLQLADALIETVSPADNAQNPRRTFVQAYLGKVALARGNEKGLAMARDYFEQVLASSSDEAELFDAHFFRTVAEIKDRNIPAAREQFARFTEWFDKQSLPDRKPLLMVLQYRLEDAAAQHAATLPERDAAQAAATNVLVDLVEDYEGYRSIVTEQLLSRVDDSTDLWTLSPLLLDALVDRGRQEAAVLAQKQAMARDGSSTTLPSDVEPDVAVIERGIAAADELLRRAAAGDKQVDATAVARNAFLRGLMLDILDRNLEAAEAFVSFDEMPGAEPQQRISAFRRALGIIEELKAASPDAGQLARIDALEGRLLPLLVGPPVNDKSRAFDLANRLHRLGQLEEAVVYYRQVPQTDPRKTDAAYLLLLAEASRMAEMDPTSPRRAALANDLPDMGQETLSALHAAMAEAGEDARDAYRERIARTKLILARLALQEDDDPAAALELLGDMEQDVAGLSDAESILSSALPLRFQATAAAGRIEEATADLLALLDRSDAQRGLSYISQFRETLNRAMQEAEARGDAAAVARLMQTRAAVTPRLVDWIEQNDDPEYRKYIYNFRRFDAETQHQAALAATDPGERRALLGRAMEAYRALQGEENLARYRELLEGMTAEQRQTVEYDRDVVFALGNIHFELGEWEDARSYYGRLLADRAMGNATRTIQQDGVSRQAPNNDFWELYYKFIRTNLELGHAPDPMRQQLRNLYATYGEHVGGTAWVEEFEALREELLGEAAAPATREAAERGS